MSSSVKNYTEQGGERTVIGGELFFEEGAQVTGLPSSGVPLATADTAGIVKPGDGLEVDEEGKLSVSSSGGGGGGGGAVSAVLLNMGGVDMSRALREAVDVTSSCSVSTFLNATSGTRPALIYNVYWGDDLYSCQAIATRKRTALTAIGAALDNDARLMNVVMGILYLENDRVLFRARLLMDDEPAVEGVSVYPDNATLSVGDTLQINAEVYPSDAFDNSVYWQSSDDSVASIIDGEYENAVTVEARGVGTATVTVTTNDGGYTASCEITVMEDEPVEDPSTDDPDPDPEP